MTTNMMKAKVKQGEHFMREWIQQDLEWILGTSSVRLSN